MNGVLLYAVLLMVLGTLDALAAMCAESQKLGRDPPDLGSPSLPLQLETWAYVIHRAEHTVPSLWRFHAIHHSAEEMDWLVGFRFHPVDLLLIRIASLGPLVALHVTPAAIGIFIAISGWQSWLVHANVRIGAVRSDGYSSRRSFTIGTSAEREAFDKNYASVIACWDVLFGTVHLPRGRKPMRSG